MLIQDLCKGGAAKILPTLRSGVAAAAKFRPENGGSRGGAGPPRSAPGGGEVRWGKVSSYHAFMRNCSRVDSTTSVYNLKFKLHLQ